MANRRLLTLQDLYEYYSSENKTVHFSANDDNKNLIVQVDGRLAFSEEDAINGLLPVELWACHTEKNLNNSTISEESMTAALPSFSNRPILGLIHEVDGELQFSNHAYHIDENGEVVYDEVPVGTIPESCNAHLEDGDNGKKYCVVNGYIFEEYSKAADILRRDGQCDVSVELSISELSYDKDSGCLNIEKFYFSGVTILGYTDDGEKVLPGMQGAHIKISDFSKQNNSLFEENKVLKMLEMLNEKVEALSINNSREEEMFMENEELNVLESEEETETTEEFESEQKVIEYNIKYNETDHFVQRSLSDIIFGLTDLVNATYVDDGTWYAVDCFDGGTAKTKYVIMTDVYSNLSYRQAYTVKDGVYSLKGERVAVHAVYMTDEEEADFEKIRSNYSVIENELNLFKAEPEKIELLNSEDYSKIKDTAEFAELSKRENYFELDKEDLAKKLDDILLSYAKQNKIEFSVAEEENEPKVSSKRMPIQKKSAGNGRYGSLFAK